MSESKSLLEKIRSFSQNSYQKGKQLLRPLMDRWKVFYGHSPRLALTVAVGGSLFLLLFTFVFTLTTLTYFGAFGQLPTYPDLKAIKNNVASEVYSEDGVLLGKYFIENRVNADFEEMSPALINALVATEDARFFEHSGVDFRAWIRVALRTVLLQDRSGGGGSTISQQLAKNLFPRQQHALFTVPITKIKEIFIARRLERIYTKQELLNLYLNTVPFGADMYGVKVAAQRFFNTAPQHLKIEEAAVLVGMLKGNNSYNPVKHPERAKTRRNTVFQQMVKYEYLTANAADSLAQLPLEVSYYKEGNNQGLATFFREHLRLEIADLLKSYKKQDGTSYNLYTDGLKIHTTVNARLQRYAEAAVQEHLAGLQQSFFKHWKNKKSYGNEALLKRAKQTSNRYQKLQQKGLDETAIEAAFEAPTNMSIYDYTNGSSKDTLLSPNDSLKYYLSILHPGFLAVNPHNGKVLAWVGGTNHAFFQYDHVQSKRQVGSIFKPIVYARALQQNIPPCDYIDNLSMTYTQFDNWTPRNSDGEYGGVYSMEGALSHSINAATVDLMLRTGIDSVRILAEQMGIDGDIPEVPAISLGAVDASLWEMLHIYSAFANGGKRPEFSYLTKIETAEGETLINFDAKDPEAFEQVLADSIAQMMTQMLRSVADSGTARRLRYQFGLYNEIACKTGTTQGHSDGWFMGYTPNIVAGVWVGVNSPTVRFRSMQLGQGANTALPIWGRFMAKTLKDPTFKKWRRAAFTAMDSTLVDMLDCPPFLEDRSLIPLLYEDEEDYYEDGLFDWFDQLFRNGNNDSEQTLEQQLENYNRQKNDASKRIDRNNRRLEEKRKRRKKRKEFFEGVFKKDG